MKLIVCESCEAEFRIKHSLDDNYYKEKSEADAHDILLCIKEGEKLSTPVGRGRGFRYGLPNQEYFYKIYLQPLQ